MALAPISVDVSFLGALREVHPLPVDDIRVTLSITTALLRTDPVTGYTRSIPSNTITPFSTFELVSFGLSILQNNNQLRQVIDPWFARVGINTASILYDTVVEDIVECGVRAARTRVDAGESDCGTLFLICFIKAMLPDTDIDGDTESESESDSDSDSESESEMNNYGMVAAREASIEEMLERVEVEAGDETCVICLNELEVGFEACRMPCSHGFHGDCIEKWLRQSHYCPICRFEMPTD